MARLYASALARELSPSAASATTRRAGRKGCDSRLGAPPCANAGLALHGRERCPAMQRAESDATLSMLDGPRRRARLVIPPSFEARLCELNSPTASAHHRQATQQAVRCTACKIAAASGACQGPLAAVQLAALRRYVPRGR